MPTSSPAEFSHVALGAAIEIRDLCVRRGGRLVLRGIGLEVESGSVTGLLGASGCGKTTLLRVIVGVQIIQSGDAWVLGAPAGANELRRRVGYMTQAPSVYTDLSVRENLRYFARVLGTHQGRVDEVIETVSLSERADRVVGDLSGGERARVSLATTLLGDPELLVLDEPTVGLDPVLRRDLWATFRRLATSGVTLLISSHVMDEAEHCDKLLLMRDGKVLRADSPDNLRSETGKQSLDQAFLALIEQQGPG